MDVLKCFNGYVVILLKTCVPLLLKIDFPNTVKHLLFEDFKRVFHTLVCVGTLDKKYSKTKTYDRKYYICRYIWASVFW